MTSQTSNTSVPTLFDNAIDDGTISPDTAQAIQLTNLGGAIQTGMGISVDDVSASEVVLVTQLLDDSSSISYENNTQLVCDGHNLVIESLEGSKQSDGVLAHATALNSGTLYPYGPINGVRIDPVTYRPQGKTPLYDKTAVALATVLAKAQEFEDNGVACRSVTLILTDGADYGSNSQTPSSVRKLVEDMLQTEQHIIAFMGIDDGSTDFTQVARDMGIRDEWILTPGNSESDIRNAFQVFSQSAVRASQGVGGFSQAALGGFGS